MDFIFILALGMASFVLIGIALQPSTESSSVSARLEGLRVGQQKTAQGSLRDQDEMSKSFFTRVVLPIVDKLSRFFTSLTPQTSLNRARVSIIRAGLVGKINPVQLATLSYLAMGILPVVSLLVTGAPDSFLSRNTLLLVMSAILGYRLPYGIVQGKAQKRQHEIRKALPFTLDLISISVEAGMALDGAIAIVTEKTTGPMAEELSLTLREIRLGKGRNEALIDMAERIGIDELRSFITAVTYIAKLGGSLVDVIRIQATAMRIKRRQRAEEKAMKTPVKIMIPLVLFIFPSMFIVILGPAMIQMMNLVQQLPK